MNLKQWSARGVILLIVVGGGLAACSPGFDEESIIEVQNLERGFAPAAEPAAFEFAEEEAEFALGEADFANESIAFDTAGDDGFNQSVAQAQDRLIIRTGSLSLVVEDTLESIDAVNQMAESMGGFVVSSDTYQSSEEAYFGNITIRVPAERFEQAMEMLKGLSLEVTNENISGQDVTEEFVDLEARLGNLKSAETQLQRIMENAQDTEDVLNVFNQLTQIRGQIESIEGRMKYLSQSASLSTIHVNLTPNIVTQPVSLRWQPLEIIRRAVRALGRGVTGLINVLIYIVIAILPVLLIIGVVLSPLFFAGRGLLRRRRRRRAERE